MAVMAQREALEIEGEIRSDTQALHRLVAAMLAAGEVQVLRDPTRGGLATSLTPTSQPSAVPALAESVTAG